ncbi:EAL domain-containing protein [Colwellia sp. MEBiC06753]
MPVYAAQDTIFSFADFNIAFVLGLSLPILLISILINRIVPNPWWYFAGLMLSAIGFLYSITYLVNYQAPALLTFATTTLCFMYLWALASSSLFYIDQESDYYPHISLAVKLLSAASAIYVALIWLVPSLDAYIGWLTYTGIILFAGAVHIALLAKIAPQHVIRLVGQWLVVGAFATIMFFYLNAQVGLNWLIIAFITSFIVALVNGNWELIHKLYQLVTDNKEQQGKQLTPDQLFSFTHDPATNLPSYQQAIMRFEQLAKQSKSNQYAIIVIKPKNFEHVNRVLGHQNSDILLLQLAYCLKREVSKLDYLMNFDFSDINAKLARLPSLNFMLAMDLSKLEHSREVAIDHLCQQLASAVPPAMSFKSFSLRFELACGVAYTDEHGHSISEVISHAGDAVFIAEKLQALWSLFDRKVAQYTDQQLHKMEQLKQDIHNDKLVWQVSPQFDIDSRQIKGFTLFPTWHFGGRKINSAEFIELAEQSGEINNLTKKQIVQACHTLSELKQLNVYQSIGIELNSSDLLEPDLVDFIEAQIAKFQIAPKYLMIQMSESVMQVAVDRAKQLIAHLKSLEVAICIDDFSGGYESLRYIRKLSVDQVKISCSYLGMSESGSAEKAIVNSLINLARTMGLNYLASDIQTKEALEAVAVMGCKVVEGEVLTPAINIEELNNWIESWFKRYPAAHTRSSAIDI